MANKTDIVVRLTARTEQLEKKLKRAEQRLKQTQTRFGGIAKGIQGHLLAAFGAAAIVRGISNVTSLYNKQAQALAQVKAGLETTQGAAGKTFGELQKMASDLQKKTLFGDEEILQGATAQLLTFTNIANEQFDRTQMAVLNLSTRLNQDLKSSAIQLGKALNDPVANLSALSRSGIQFSKEQKQVINALVETNRLAEAQTIILDELEKQYGGSAEAAASAGTGGWTQLRNAFGDLKETIGALVVENSGTKGLSGWLTEITQKADDFLKKGGVSKLAVGLAGAAGGRVSGAAGKSIALAAARAASDEALEKLKEEVRLKNQILETERKMASLRLKPVQSFTGKGGHNLGDIGLSGTGGVVPSLDVANDALKRQFIELQNIAREERDKLNAIVEGTFEAAIEGFIVGLSTGGLRQALEAMLNIVADGLAQFGKLLIAQGIAIEAFKRSLQSLQGPVAVGAGIALLAAAGAVKNFASSFGSNPTGGAGSASFGGRSITGQSVSFEGRFVVEGDKLVSVINNSNKITGRTG